jgi:hypothetical protein
MIKMLNLKIKTTKGIKAINSYDVVKFYSYNDENLHLERNYHETDGKLNVLEDNIDLIACSIRTHEIDLVNLANWRNRIIKRYKVTNENYSDIETLKEKIKNNFIWISEFGEIEKIEELYN